MAKRVRPKVVDVFFQRFVVDLVFIDMKPISESVRQSDESYVTVRLTDHLEIFRSTSLRCIIGSTSAA
jgi:hypothetical protein